MEDKDKVIASLFQRLEELTRQQKGFQQEIHDIHQELVRLTGPESRPVTTREFAQTAAKKPETDAGPVAISAPVKPPPSQGSS